MFFLRSFLGLLRTVFGVVFVAIGFLVGFIGVCGCGVYAWLWFTGDPFSENDRRVWLTLTGCAVLGAGVFALGRWLHGRAPSTVDGAFSPAAGARQRNTATGNLNGTFIWPLAAALWYFVRPAPEAAPTWPGALAGALFIYAGFQLIVLCHELGHLGAALLAGMEPRSLRVGTGPRLFRARPGGVLVEIRALLGGGLVDVDNDEEQGWRRRQWLCIAGGPALHAVALAALGVWLRGYVGAPPGTGWQWLGLAWQGDAPAFFGLWLLSLMTWVWVFALVPRAARFGAVQTRTDGSWLLRIPRLPQAAVRQQAIASALRSAQSLWEQDRRPEAWTRVRATLARYPDDPILAAVEGYYLGEESRHAEAEASFARSLARADYTGTAETLARVRAILWTERFAALVRAGEPIAAREAARQALRETTVPAERAELLDGLASKAFVPEFHAFLPEADAWSAEMLALEPDSLTRLCTRGALLAELGRFDEAVPMLHRVWAKSRRDGDAALSAFALGLAARARGQTREMQHWRKRAASFAAILYPWFRERIKRELDPEVLEAARPITPLI